MANSVMRQNAAAMRVNPRASLRALRNVLSILLIGVITLVMLELALNMFDPLGMVYFQQLIYLEPFYVDGGGDYILPPGVYHMKGWTATVEDDYMRAVPASRAGCKVLFMGDSLTFGWGVNDDQTFPDHIARELGIKAINAGMIGYNTWNVAASLDSYDDYDLGVYLLFENDALLPLPYGGNPPQSGEHHFQRLLFHQSDRPLTALYAIYVFDLGAPKDYPRDMDSFYAGMERITGQDNMLVFGFPDELTTTAQALYAVQVIPRYTTQISRVDPHPDAAGQRHIADAMLPTIRERLGDHCAPEESGSNA